MDGWVKIGTALDTKQLEKDIKSAESKLKQFQREEEKLSTQKAKIDIDLASYEEQKQKIREATDLTLQQANTEEQVNWVLEQEKGEIAQLNNEYSKTLSSNESINQKIAQNKEQQSALNNEISEMNSKLSQSKGFQNVTNSIRTASSETSNIIKKIGKWALAVFSIRSAYSFVRNAISTVSQYNEQVATDIEYIRYALAMMLEPVIKWIINLVKTLLIYINYIAQAWFGVNLFANAGAKAFQKAKDNASGVKNNIDDAAKSAKKLNKEIAGFDEMNVLGGNVDESADTKADKGVGGGTPLPSFDLSSLEGEPPEWLKWIVDNKDLILSILVGVAAGLLAWKLGLSGIQSLGVGIAVAGIVYAIQGLLDYLKNPTWENFGKVVTGIGIAIAGLALAFGGLAAWPVILAGIFVAILGIVISNWENIKKSCLESIDFLLHSGDPFLEYVGQLLKGVLEAFDLMFQGLKDMFDGIIDFVVGVFTGDWDKALDGLAKVFQGLLETLIGLLLLFWNPIKDTIVALSLWIYDVFIKPVIKFFTDLWNSIVNGFRVAVTTIKNIFNSIVSFFSGIINSIINLFRTIGTNVGNVVVGAFKAVVNGVLGAIESILNSPINAINGLISVINAVPGINIRRLSTFRLPRLAKGGIINQPGRGVPLGSAIGGESGREGVIPLTDQQAMAQLGMEIGKNVVINLTNVTKLDNRQIAKEQKRINQQNDFAYNR